MIQINLIPDVKQALLNAQRARNTVVSVAIIAGIGSVGVVLLLLSIVYGGQLAFDRLADNDIDARKGELAKVEDASSILTIQNQLAALQAVGDNKLITSRLFDVVSASLAAGTTSVAYSSVSLEENENGSRIVLEGQSADGFADVEVLTKVLTSMQVRYGTVGASEETSEIAPLVTDRVVIEEKSLARDDNDVLVMRFKLSFAYASELFASSSANVRIGLERAGNVTDSYLSIPRFVNRATDIKEGQQ